MSQAVLLHISLRPGCVPWPGDQIFVEHKRGIRTGFAPSTWVSSYHYHSTTDPYATLSKSSLYQNVERAKAENLTKSNARSKIIG